MIEGMTTEQECHRINWRQIRPLMIKKGEIIKGRFNRKVWRSFQILKIRIFQIVSWLKLNANRWILKNFYQGNTNFNFKWNLNLNETWHCKLQKSYKRSKKCFLFSFQIFSKISSYFVSGMRSTHDWIFPTKLGS